MKSFIVYVLLAWTVSFANGQDRYVHDLEELFDFGHYGNGTDVPIKVKKGVILAEGVYNDTTSRGGQHYQVNYNPLSEKMICDVFHEAMWMDTVIIKTHMRFTVVNGVIRQFEEYHNGLLFQFLPYRTYIINQDGVAHVVPGDIRITSNADEGYLVLTERMNDSINKRRMFLYSTLIEEGHYCRRRKQGIWKTYSGEGIPLKEEYWNDGTLSKTVTLSQSSE